MKPGIAISVAAVVVVTALISLLNALRTEPVVTSGGSITIPLEGSDPLIDQLEQLGGSTSGGATPPSSDFGGSGLEQSPSFDQDAWRGLMDGNIQ